MAPQEFEEEFVPVQGLRVNNARGGASGPRGLDLESISFVHFKLERGDIFESTHLWAAIIELFCERDHGG